MLSDIVKTWPPRPGPEETNTGIKQRLMTVAPILGFVEALDDLHEPAWWTGVKLVTAATEGIAIFSVRLVDRDGRPFFDSRCVWDQPAGEWGPFPWPISAPLATARGLQLRVSRIDCDQPLFMSARTCFHEMTKMDPTDSYVYVDEVGAPVYVSSGSNGLDDYMPVPPTATLHQWTGVRVPVAAAMDVD